MSRIRPPAILAAAAFASIAFHVWESRDQWLVSDETYFIGFFRGFHPDAILGSDAGNLVAIPLLIYNGIWELFGIENLMPQRLVWSFLVTVCAVLFYLAARKRAGDWIALWPAVLLMFLGASGEVHSHPIGMTHLLAASFGLGALLCLDRNDRAGDIGALVLLSAACATYTTGIAFLAGAAVDLARRRRFDPRAAAVVGLPVLLYGAWRLWIGATDETSISINGLLAVGPTALELFASAMTAISGTFQFAREPFGDEPGNEVPGTTWGLVLGAIAIGLAVWRYSKRGHIPIDGRIWTYLAIALVYWTMLAAKDPPIIDAEITRYTFLGSIMLLLVGVELLAGVRLERGWRNLLLAGFAFSLLANALMLHDAAKFDRVAADRNRGQLGVVELVGAQAAPYTAIEPLPSFVTTDPFWDMFVTVGPYLGAVDEFGSAGYASEEILERPEHVRRYADEELLFLLQPRPEPVDREQFRGDCTPVESGQRELTVPPSGVSIQSGPGQPPQLSLRRFADRFYTPLPTPPAERVAIRLPEDAIPVPWHLSLTASAPLTVCPL